MRNSVVLYPIANVAHVVAVVTFFATVAAMDLGFLGVIPTAPRRLVARLRPAAIAAFALVAATGAMLFLPDAVKIGSNTAFLFKLAAIGLALSNVALNEWVLRRRGESSLLARGTAGLSLAIWLVVCALGRAIAYV